MGTDFERRLSSEHFGRAEGPCATSRRFHEAVLQVIVSPSWDRLFVITGTFASTLYFNDTSPENPVIEISSTGRGLRTAGRRKRGRK